MRRVLQVVTLILAVGVGYALAIAFAPGVVAPSMTPEPGERTAPDTTTTSSTTATSTTSTLAAAETYLIWSTGGLTPELVTSLTDAFEDISVVRGDAVELDAGDGAVVPLDALAIDPQSHAVFDPAGSLAGLRPGLVVLGETSADFRGAGVGDLLTIGGVDYEVTAIAPDDVVGAAEVVFAQSDASSPVTTDRYVLVSTEMARNEFEDRVRAMYDGPAPLRIRTEGETPWLRHGDAVLPQILIKKSLGEFSYANRSGSEFSQDPEFVGTNIVTTQIPILGEVRCHRTVAEMLDGAMSQLVEEGLGHLVDPAGFAGCWNPRYIRPTTGRSSGISRHAWGAAVDLNTPSNPIGSAGTQDPRLVEVMAEWGFTWGGDWLVPDPMHFEYGIVP